MGKRHIKNAHMILAEGLNNKHHQQRFVTWLVYGDFHWTFFCGKINLARHGYTKRIHLGNTCCSYCPLQTSFELKLKKHQPNVTQKSRNPSFQKTFAQTSNLTTWGWDWFTFDLNGSRESYGSVTFWGKVQPPKIWIFIPVCHSKKLQSLDIV